MAGIFISYARKDDAFAQKLNIDLQEEGIVTWIDQLGIRSFDDWPERIAKAIEECNAMLVIVSPTSMKSKWVRRELAMADSLDKKVLPLIYRPGEFPRWFRLRFSNVQWADFTEGKYEGNLGKMVKTLYEVLPEEAIRREEEEAKESIVKPVGRRTLEEILRITTPVEMELIYVQGGEFLMGSGDDEKDADDNEKPQHRVEISDFYIGKYPVTNRQYEAFVRKEGEEAPYHWKTGNIPSGLENHPVVNVTWRKAIDFCEWLIGETGRVFRLPTEAEWEYAARGGEKSKGFKYAGSNDIDEVAWYRENSGDNSHPVGGKKPNELGIYDMSGNVWELCSSLFKDYPYKVGDGREDLKAEGMRVMRGGAYGYYHRSARCAVRYWSYPVYRISYVIGFRVVVSP